MLSIKRSQVPFYLKASAFYKSLNEEDDEEIVVQSKNMKKTPKVSNPAELIHLFSSARFWGLDDLPEDALHYTIYIAKSAVFDQIEEYEDHIKTIACLKAIRFAKSGEQKVFCAEFGRIDFIKYLMKMGNVLQASAGIQAASNNHLACLEFITNSLVDENGKDPYYFILLHDLPATISYACLKHLHQHGSKIETVGSVTKAAEAGNLACLQYMHENNAKIAKRSMEVAVSNGHLPCVAFIHEQGEIACEVNHANLAAAGGHLDCLTYLFEHGCPPDDKICRTAAHAGHSECLKYAHEQGCSINKTTMTR